MRNIEIGGTAVAPGAEGPRLSDGVEVFVIAHGESRAPGELALDIQVPLRPVRTTGIEFNVRGLDCTRIEQTQSLTGKGRGQRRGCAIGDRSLLIIRCRPWDDADKYMWQGDD